jgi:hypothetical protein
MPVVHYSFVQRTLLFLLLQLSLSKLSEVGHYRILFFLHDFFLSCQVNILYVLLPLLEENLVSLDLLLINVLGEEVSHKDPVVTSVFNSVKGQVCKTIFKFTVVFCKRQKKNPELRHA